MRIELLLTPLLLAVLCSEILLTAADDPSVITTADKKELKDLYVFFLPYFNAEKSQSYMRQFAVLYYGSPNLNASIRIQQCKKQTKNHVFIDEPLIKFDVSQCNYIAALQKQQGGQHTESASFLIQSLMCVQRL